MLGDLTPLESVRRLHSLELYEDLLLYADLNLSEQYKQEKLSEENQAFVHFCLGDAHFELGNNPQAIRHFEHVLKIVSLMRRKDPQQGVSPSGGKQTTMAAFLSPAEVRFRMHKALLREGKEGDALKCLEQLPKSEMPPKILYAIARLHTNQRKPLLRSATAAASVQCFSSTPGIRVVNHLKQLAKLVPEAVLCKSYLVSTNNLQLDENNNTLKLSVEARAWLDAKRLEGQRKFADAAQVLAEVQNPSIRTVLELARFYLLAGVKHKALANYQRAHSLDQQNVEGMDVLASLLCQSNCRPELEHLVNKLAAVAGANGGLTLTFCPPELFIAYGYLARMNKNTREGLQFAQKAESLAQTGRQRAEALLLKAQLQFDQKRNFKELNVTLAEALSNDSLNIQCYELYVKGCLQLKAYYNEALRVCDKAARNLGVDNPRIKFLRAKVLAEQGTDSAASEAVHLLEEVVERAPHIADAVPLLASLYDRAQNFEKAVAFLRRCKEMGGGGGGSAASQVSRLLGDFLLKLNRHEAASQEYTNALVCANPDPQALNKMAALSTNLQHQQLSPDNGNQHSPPISTRSSSSITGSGGGTTIHRSSPNNNNNTQQRAATGRGISTATTTRNRPGAPISSPNNVLAPSSARRRQPTGGNAINNAGADSDAERMLRGVRFRYTTNGGANQVGNAVGAFSPPANNTDTAEQQRSLLSRAVAETRERLRRVAAAASGNTQSSETTVGGGRQRRNVGTTVASGGGRGSSAAHFATPSPISGASLAEAHQIIRAPARRGTTGTGAAGTLSEITRIRQQLPPPQRRRPDTRQQTSATASRQQQETASSSSAAASVARRRQAPSAQQQRQVAAVPIVQPNFDEDDEDDDEEGEEFDFDEDGEEDEAMDTSEAAAEEVPETPRSLSPADAPPRGVLSEANHREDDDEGEEEEFDDAESGGDGGGSESSSVYALNDTLDASDADDSVGRGGDNNRSAFERESEFDAVNEDRDSLEGEGGGGELMDGEEEFRLLTEAFGTTPEAVRGSAAATAGGGTGTSGGSGGNRSLRRRPPTSVNMEVARRQLDRLIETELARGRANRRRLSAAGGAGGSGGREGEEEFPSTSQGSSSTIAVGTRRRERGLGNDEQEGRRQSGIMLWSDNGSGDTSDMEEEAIARAIEEAPVEEEEGSKMATMNNGKKRKIESEIN